MYHGDEILEDGLVKPYMISITADVPGGWLNFALFRTVRTNPDGIRYCDSEVYLRGECVVNLISDVPEDEHDTEDIIDELNSLFNLGLY